MRDNVDVGVVPRWTIGDDEIVVWGTRLNAGCITGPVPLGRVSN